MAVRAKMNLMGIVPNTWGGFQALFQCEYDAANPDDVKFCKATPNGDARFSIDNPAAIEQLVIGKKYYFDITPAE
ncbi:hypothetical protein SAMN06265338_1346 [Rhodoblastus acidophilus]|uniref:Uncharacterized protein n=1 Tax=Rhodoblastus acidophilus TaxID=1074 RepID=A0A212SEZ1_RHOAC|nr:hypothetical protein [Rhodoblastus acidophilus]PPQ37087.1 hypothetical protein CKO16_15975 [Rhodoblastus acidophilus]RAI16728.1 hypothetical protein CH337_19920 [Rhodoblastus acidophilus]SNB84223.1 hypothetical protein SAMN06265338_1346 [Rhodoblastus acidophilus]